jgi:hypothetical protein
MRTALVCTAALALSAAGCGYHVSGRADLMPKNVKTIAITAFGNATTRYQLARILPADLSREFLARTRYEIVADPRTADAVLSGSVIAVSAVAGPLDPTTNRATAVDAVVQLQVTLTDRVTGKAIFSRPSMSFRQRYEVTADPKAYFDESGTAMQRLSRDVARTVVSAVLEMF